MQWAIAVFFIFFTGLALAELASSAPTSGGLYYWTWDLASPRWRNLLSWVVGCEYASLMPLAGTSSTIADKKADLTRYELYGTCCWLRFRRMGTRCADYGCCDDRHGQPLRPYNCSDVVSLLVLSPTSSCDSHQASAVYVALLIVHGFLSSLATSAIALLQTLYVAVNTL